jgi:hypothetical protein
MRTTKLLQGTCLIGASLFVCSAALGADNCTGYDTSVNISAETLDLGNGHTLTAFRGASMLTSEDSIYQLTTGECSGSALNTPDGKVRVSGHCARRDKDGDTHSIEFSEAAGADKGTWKSTGGTGKFANKSYSGWYQNVRTDGKMTIFKWGGSCK